MLTCYPVPGKAKSLALCEAFADGCGGRIAYELHDGPAFFGGVMPNNLHLWRAVRRREADPVTAQGWYFCDNAYFDASRETYFRVSKDRLQHTGLGASDGRRLEQLGIEVEPWRTGGASVLLCPQSEFYLRSVELVPDWWPLGMHAQLRRRTPRDIVLRAWDRNKGVLAHTLRADLERTHCVVTWNSAAAITAILAGVPAVCLGESAAAPVATPLNEIDTPRRLDREAWAAVLADNQWTMDEMRKGMAWAALNRN